MSDDLLATLRAVDPAVLTEAARQSLGVSAFKLGDWSVSPLRHEKVIETTGGLFCFSGRGWDGAQERDWSLILKIILQPGNDCLEPGELCYWQREMLAYQSGMLSALPAGIRAPVCYGVSSQTQSGWIWMEHVHERDGLVWTLAHYERAAHHLGQFAGASLMGRPCLTHTWLCTSLMRSFYADGTWWEHFMNPASPKNAWQVPVVQRVYSEALRKRVLQIWAEKEALITANEGLPQVLCHNDAHRRNLMLRENENGEEELVAMDWAFCGPGGLGNDLGELVGTSLSYFAVDPIQASELERAVLAGYLAGLRAAGWEGDERLARLGYLLCLALYWGGTLPSEVSMTQPGATTLNVEAKYGRALEDVLPGWTRLAAFALDRADEARYWIRRLI